MQSTTNPSIWCSCCWPLKGAGADHLKALARVSRILRNKAFCEKLRGTDNPDALYALLVEAGMSATDHLRVAS